jgi:ABC-type spermidine/putrescine transport system permease subunit I
MISNVVVSRFGAAYDWPLGAAISLSMLTFVVLLLMATERIEPGGVFDEGRVFSLAAPAHVQRRKRRRVPPAWLDHPLVSHGVRR